MLVVCLAFVAFVMLLTIVMVVFDAILNPVPVRSRHNEGWTIVGFNHLLKAVKSAEGNRKATVRTRDGRVYVVELYEVRENPDGSIEKISEVDPGDRSVSKVE